MYCHYRCNNLHEGKIVLSVDIALHWDIQQCISYSKLLLLINVRKRGVGQG